MAAQKREPTTEEVAAFIKAHPHGADFATIAVVLNVSHQRCQMILQAALSKVTRELEMRGILGHDDML